MPDIATLGFEFTYGQSARKAKVIADLLATMADRAPQTKTALDGLFSNVFISSTVNASSRLGKVAGALKTTATFGREAATVLDRLPSRLSKINSVKIKPISADAVNSIEKAAGSIGNIINRMDTLVARTRNFAKAMADARKHAMNIAGIVAQMNGAILNTARNSRQLGVAVTGANQAIVSTGGATRSLRQLNDATLLASGRAEYLTNAFNRLFQTGVWAMAFKKSLKEAIDFGVEIAQIQSLSQNFDPSKLRTGLLNISSEFGKASKLAQAEYYAYSSGVRDTEQGMADFTQTMAKTATVIRADVVSTMNAATSAMNAYGLSAKNSAELSDLFYMIVKQGKATGEQLASSLGQVIPTAASAGITLNELGAAIASLTKVQPTRNAITYLNNAISKLMKPTKESMSAAHELGIEIGINAIRSKGFVNVLSEIREKTMGSREALLRIFPDLRGQRAALQLLVNGWGDFQYQLTQFENKAGAADAAFEVLSNDINYQMSVLPNTINKIGIATGKFIIDVVTLGGALTPVIAAFNRMGETGQTVLGGITALTGGYVLLRGAMFAYNALKAMDIRNTQTITAAKAGETAATRANTAALLQEAAARKASAAAAGASVVSGSFTIRTGSKIADYAQIELAQKLAREKAVMSALAYEAARADYAYAKASGSAAAATAAHTQMISAKNAMLAADLQAQNMEMALFMRGNVAYAARNTLLKQNILLLKAQAAASAFAGVNAGGSIFSALGSNRGFWGGMGRSGIHNLKSWKWKSGAGMFASFTSINGMVSKLGFALGKLGSVITAVFNPATLIIGGSIAVVGSAIDLIFNEGKVVKSIGEKLYDFFTGAITTAKKVSEAIDEANNFRRFGRADIAAFLKNSLSFVDLTNNNDSGGSGQKLSDLGRNLKQEFDRYAPELRRMGGELAQVTEERLKIEDRMQKNVFNQFELERKAQQEYLKKFQGNARLAVPIDAYVKQYVAERKAIWDADVKRVEEIKKQSEDLQKKITPIAERIKESGASFMQEYRRITASIGEMQNALESMRISILSPAEAFENNRKAYDDAMAMFAEAQRNQTFGPMKDAVNAMVNNFRSMQSYAQSQMKIADEMTEEIRNNYMKILGEGNLEKRMQIARNRANEALQKGGFVNGTLADNADPQKAMEAYRRAYSLLIPEQERAIARQAQLAQAERAANRETMNLVRTLGAFSETATEAVNANSAEAMRLQSRAFMKIPGNLGFSNTESAGLARENERMNALLEEMRGYASAIRDLAEQRGTADGKTIEQRNADIMRFIEANKNYLEAAQKQFDEQARKAKEDTGKLENLYKTLDDSSKRTADNTTKIAGAMQNIGLYEPA